MAGTNPKEGEFALVYLKDLMPEHLKPRYDLEKHRLTTMKDLREFFDRQILDWKADKAQKPGRGLHELEAPKAEDPGEGGEAEEDGSQWWCTLLSWMGEEDVAKILTGPQLLSFQRWKKGGGKGKTGGGGGGSWRPGPGSSGAAAPGGQAWPPPGVVSLGARPGAAPFDGPCHFCKGTHKIGECLAYDKYKQERGAAKGEKGKGGGKGGLSKGKGKGAYSLDYNFLDSPPAYAPGGPAAAAGNGPQAGNQGWHGRICAPLLRVDPSAVELSDLSVQPPRESANLPTRFETPNRYEALASSVERDV